MSRKIAPSLTAMVDSLSPVYDSHWTEKTKCVRELRALLAVARAAEKVCTADPETLLARTHARNDLARALSRLSPSKAPRGRAGGTKR
jgi:hypothetical protein